MTVRLEELLAAATPWPWVNDHGALRQDDGHLTRLAVFDAHHGTTFEVPRNANANLAALAPEMARLLIEWAGDDPERLARLDRLGKDTTA